MTLLLALVHSGAILAEEGTFRAPYFIGGGILLVLIAAILALLAFGKGREHS
jgi:hypothetical protein